MRSIACFALMAAFAAGAFADEIVMKNGDKITGKIVDLAGGKLKVETAHSGVVTLEWKEVASLTSDAPIRVKLANGERLEGKVVVKDGKIRVESEGAPREVPPDQLKGFNEPPVEWHGGFNLAARSSDGNTHTTSGLLTLDAMRESEQDRMSLKAVFKYGKTKDVITERNGYGIGKYEYFISDRMYAFGALELLTDRFKDLRYRTTVSAGLGYIFIKEAPTDLWADIGPAYIHNDFIDGEDESHAAARIGAHFRQVLPLSLELVDDFWITPNLEEGDDWQARNDLSVTAGLGVGWSFKTGVITDYDNDPPDGVRKHDNTYYVGLGYRF
jgi:putative salt-induced outer membrane protein YdiY